VVEGFKIPDFKFGDQYYDIRTALKLREKHQEITGLMKSMGAHGFPPSTFDEKSLNLLLVKINRMGD